ncbi:MAG: 30S ribosomal protein S1 [Lachnospiraceae bacterium]|nr:30S ribosomal protein S1 [Lachnospiraceae bacterium]
MSESFEQLLNESIKTIRTGEVVKGTVIAVKENEIELNIGYKHDGVIQKNEFTNDPDADLQELVHVGDELEAKILKVNDGDGLVQLSARRVRTEKTSKVLEDAFNAEQPIKAVVDEVVKGGLSCTVDEVKVFIPASLVSDTFERDLSKYEGQEIEFMLTEYNPRKHRVIGDRKQLVIAQKKAALEALLSKISVGDVVEGTVKNITDFGAFIDLGGADGLLHISEMSWGRIESPKKVFRTGDHVTAFIKSIDGTKIALSRKFPDENPWADAETRFAVGNVVTGKVARLTDFGAFIELAKGVDGLLHVSQIKRERVEKPADVLTQGEEITAKIVDLDLDNKKISLSMKALLPKPERRGNNRPRRNREEENVDEADVDIEAYIRRMEADEKRKEEKAAAEAAKAAEEAAAAVEEKAEEVVEAAAEAVAEEVKDAEVAEAVEAVAEEVKDAE